LVALSGSCSSAWNGVAGGSAPLSAGAFVQDATRIVRVDLDPVFALVDGPSHRGHPALTAALDRLADGQKVRR
jgi:hypothetical protein